MSRGDVQVLISSLHVIANELSSVKVEVPQRVYDELEAMERFLKREWDAPKKS